MMESQDSGNLDRQERCGTEKVSLDQALPQVGIPIQLQMGGTRHVATLIGYLKGQSFIVTMPEANGRPIRPDAGQSLAVRFFNDKRSYGFNTVVRHMASEPFPHLHLVWPEQARELKDRQYERIRINITGSADVPDGKSFTCVVRDISMGGALIAAHDQTGKINDHLVLTLHLVVEGVEYSMSLDSEIRSVRIADPSDSSGSSVLHGLAFHNLTRQEVLALAAFDLLPDWNASA